jgi:MoaA/NifB/PqqE/SkfB family radical SAM enzyme
MDIKTIKKVNVDVSTFCNHACDFCSNPDDRTKKFRMSPDDFVRVMDNIGQYIDFRTIEDFGLSAKGEPLTNKSFIEIVSIAKQKYQLQYIYISSNGVVINARVAEQLFEAGLDSIKFSINAISRESYAQTHGKDQFSKAVQGLKHTIALKKCSFPNINILISCISSDSQEDIERFWQEELDSDYQYINGIWKRDLLFTPADLQDVEDESKIVARCNKPFDEVWVNADCHLFLCCMDYFGEVDLGSLLEHDFLALWNGEAMNEVREMHQTGKFPSDHICYRCLAFSEKVGSRPG